MAASKPVLDTTCALSLMIVSSAIVLFVCFLSSPGAFAQSMEAEDIAKERAALEADSSVELVEFKGDTIAISYPAGWQLVPDVPKPRVLHVKALGGKVNASVTVQEIPAGTTLENYRDATTRNIESDAKDLSPKRVSEEKTHLGEAEAWKLIYSVNVPNTQPPLSAKQTLYICVKNNRGYLLCCTAFDALPGKFDSIFRLMADSLRVIPSETEVDSDSSKVI